MVSVFETRNWRAVIYSNDHTPAHVHAKGPGWEVVVNIATMEVRSISGARGTRGDQIARDVLAELRGKQAYLLQRWEEIHVRD